MESFSSFPSTGGEGARWHADVQLVIDKAELEHETSFYHGEDGLLRGLAEGEVESLARLLMVPGSLGARPRRQGLLRWLEGQKREIAGLPEALRGRRSSSSSSGGLQESIRRVMGYERRQQQQQQTRYSLCSWHRGLDGRLAYAIRVLVRREAVFRCLVFAGYRGQSASSPSAPASELGTVAARGLELIAHVGDMVGGGLDGPENPARSVVLMAASEGDGDNSGSKKGISLLLEACAGCDACTVAQVGGGNGAAVAALQASILSRNRFDVEVRGRKRRESRLLGVTAAWLGARGGGRYANLVRAFADELFEARRVVTMTGPVARDVAVVPVRRACPLPDRRGAAAGGRAGDEEQQQQQQEEEENGGEGRVSDEPPVPRWSRPTLSPIAVESLFPRIGDNGDISTETYTPWRPSFASPAQETTNKGESPERFFVAVSGGEGEQASPLYPGQRVYGRSFVAASGEVGEQASPVYPGQWVYGRPSLTPPVRPVAASPLYPRQWVYGRSSLTPPAPMTARSTVPDGDANTDAVITQPQQQQQQQRQRQRVPLQLRRRAGAQDLQGRETAEGVLVNRRNGMVPVRVTMPQNQQQQQQQQFVPKLIRKPVPIRRRPVPASASAAVTNTEAKTGKEPDAAGETPAIAPLVVEAGNAHLVPEPLMLSRGAKQQKRQYLSVPPSTNHYHHHQQEQQHRRRWSTATDDQVDAGAEANDAVVSKLLVLADEEMRAWTRHFRGSAGLRPLSLLGSGTINE